MIIGRDGDIVLRELIEEDLLKLAEYANNEKISINLRDSFPYPYSLDDARHFFESVKNDNPPSTFAIEYQGNYVGNISLVRASDVYRNSAEIGYFIGEPFWNRGIVTRAVNLITQYGFENRGIIRIFTGIFDYNKASQRVLEKCGFEKEAIFKKSITKKGKIFDEVRYSKIKSEK